MTDELEPLENSLTIEELRREVRECWDLQRDIVKALRDTPEMVAPWVQLFLGRAGSWPEDNSLGGKLQRKLGSTEIPYKSECESGAGVWYRIRQGLIAPRPDKV